MDEKDYLLATNLTKVSAALQILRDVLPGPEWGITVEELQKATKPLCESQGKMYQALHVEG